jgi:hypothetical protein
MEAKIDLRQYAGDVAARYYTETNAAHFAAEYVYRNTEPGVMVTVQEADALIERYYEPNFGPTKDTWAYNTQTGRFISNPKRVQESQVWAVAYFERRYWPGLTRPSNTPDECFWVFTPDLVAQKPVTYEQAKAICRAYHADANEYYHLVNSIYA